MLGAKEAVKTSIATFAELFAGDKYRDLRLEEIAKGQDSGSWSITVSYKNPDIEDEMRVKNIEDSGLGGMIGIKSPAVASRHYKAIIIDATDGSLVQIKSA